MLRILIIVSLVACHGDHAAPVTPPPSVMDCAASGGHGDVSSVVAAATAFRATLTPEQRGKLDQRLDRETAVAWSNLPVGIVPRHGVRMGDLDATQAASARTLLAASTSSCGLAIVDELRLADETIKDLDERHIFAWGAANYFIAFLGTPSTTTPWQLQFGGHHIAFALTFNGHQPSATPLFFGAEPVKFSSPDGVAHEPMQRQSIAIGALATAMSKHPEAHLSGTFTDVVKGVVIIREPSKPPSGGYDTGFPFTYDTGTTDRGILVSQLSPAEQQLVRTALESYAALPGDAIAKPLISAYEDPAALAATYVGTTGGTDLAKSGLYVRLDGPRLWMEFIVQDGVAYPQIAHYHALWRDKLADYGGEVGK